MLVLVGFAIALLTVPVARGRLRLLADVRLSSVWTLVASALLQILALRILRGGDPLALGLVHVTSYLFAGAFLLRNRHVPGLWLLGLGGLANLAAIAANGGVMPAAPEAWRAAGLGDPSAFTNSAVVAEPRLGFLGDVFAIPPPVPFANVFSVGDVLLIVGALVVLHRLCDSRLVPSGSRQFVSLRHHRGFMFLWSGQSVSNLGDWTYSLAVAATVAERADAAHVLATLIITQVAPAAVVGVLGGPLIDRVHRVRLMVATDVVRAAAVASLVFAGSLSLPHVYVVAAILGLSGAMFQPAMQASLPNLVPRERLVAANALVSGSYHLAVMVGPVLGGVLVAKFGAGTAFTVNAFSFILSALLIAQIRVSTRAASEQGATTKQMAALAEGLRYVRGTPLVRGILLVLGLVIFASALRSPLEPVFVIQTLGREATALGLIGGAWGLGMLLGSAAAPAAARRWPRERLFWISVAIVGVAVLAASQAQVLSPVLVFWLFAGAGNAVGTVAYESLLQERTPDALRGRIIAAVEACVHVSFLIGALFASGLASAVGIRGSYIVSGLLLLVAAMVGRRLFRAWVDRGATLPLPDDVVPASHQARHLPRHERIADADLDELAAGEAVVVASELDRAWTLCTALVRPDRSVRRVAGAAGLAMVTDSPPTLIVIDRSSLDEDIERLVAALQAGEGGQGVFVAVVGEAADALDDAGFRVPAGAAAS